MVVVSCCACGGSSVLRCAAPSSSVLIWTTRGCCRFLCVAQGLLTDALDGFGMLKAGLGYSKKAALCCSELLWADLNALAPACASFGSSRNYPGALLEPSRASLGPVLDRLGSILAYFGPVFGHLGSILGDLILVLDLSWAILGLSWTILGLSWAILALSWACLEPSWRPFGPS